MMDKKDTISVSILLHKKTFAAGCLENASVLFYICSTFPPLGTSAIIGFEKYFENSSKKVERNRVSLH